MKNKLNLAFMVLFLFSLNSQVFGDASQNITITSNASTDTQVNITDSNGGSLNIPKQIISPGSTLTFQMPSSWSFIFWIRGQQNLTSPNNTLIISDTDVKKTSGAQSASNVSVCTYSQTLVNGQCTCIAGYILQRNSNTGCQKCSANTAPNSTNDACIACPGNTVANSNNTACICTGTNVLNATQTACIACTGNTVANSDNTACVCSFKDQVVQADGQTCCPADQTGANGKCCPSSQSLVNGQCACPASEVLMGTECCNQGDTLDASGNCKAPTPPVVTANITTTNTATTNTNNDVKAATAVVATLAPADAIPVQQALVSTTAAVAAAITQLPPLQAALKTAKTPPAIKIINDKVSVIRKKVVTAKTNLAKAVAKAKTKAQTKTSKIKK